MAENDNRSILQVTPDAKGAPSLQSLNEILRQLQMNSHKLEGRLGEATVRDDLEVMGTLSLPSRTATPALSADGEGKIYFDKDELIFKASEDGGSYVDLIGGGTTNFADLTVYNVKNYGAIGDGIVNDTAAINLTITAATNGGIIFFPAGTYLVSSTINFISNQKIIIQGCGMDASTISTNQTTGDVFYIPSTIGVAGFHPTIVRQLGFRHSTHAQRTSGAYVNLDCSSAGVTTNLMPLVENCWFQDLYIGVQMNDVQGAIVSRCLFTTFSTGGVGVKWLNTAPFSADGGDNFMSQVWMVDEFQRASVGIQSVDGGAGLKICNSKTLGFNTAVQNYVSAGKSSNLFHVSDSSFESWTGVGIDFVPDGFFNHIFLQDNDLATDAVSSVGIRLAPTATGGISTAIIAGNRISSSAAAGTRSLQLIGAAGSTISDVMVYGNTFAQVDTAVEVGANTGPGVSRAWGNNITGATAAFSLGTANFKLDFINGYATKSDYGGLGTVISSWITQHGGTGIPMFEFVSAATDGINKIPGIIDFVYDTNSAGHKRVAAVSTVTDGATANQRGCGLFFSTKKNASTTLATRAVITGAGSVVIGDQAAALGTTATDGFLYIPTSAGAPTGVPTAQTGTVAMEYDTTNNNLYVYNGAWKKVLLA